MKFVKKKLLSIDRMVLVLTLVVLCALLGIINIRCRNLQCTQVFAVTDSTRNAAVFYEDDDSLGKYINGYKYQYTDLQKIEKYRNGVEESDFSEIVVNTNDVHGSQTNPYVISEAGDWEKFVKFCAANSAGVNKYFILANDIDFSGANIHPVTVFNGTFYGNNHSLKNLKIDTGYWQYWDSSSNTYNEITSSGTVNGGFGLFCKSIGATIADLFLDNYSFNNVPNIKGYPNDVYGAHVGAIVGIATFSQLNILNCHATGSIISDIIYSALTANGGIIGTLYDSSSNIYRCSANLTSTVKTNNNSIVVGGIVSGARGNIECNVFDCVASVNATVDIVSAHYDLASAIGWIADSASVKLENFIGYVDGSVINGGKNYDGALLGIDVSAKSLQLKNCFADGRVGSSDSKLSMVTIGTYQTNIANVDISTTYNVKETSNYADNIAIAGSMAVTYDANTQINSEALLNVAKGVFEKNKIWQVSKIGGYSVENNPVANKSVITPSAGENADTIKYAEDDSDVEFNLNGVDSNKVSIEISATDRNGNNLNYSQEPLVAGNVMSFMAKAAGTYTVKLKLKENHVWLDGSNDEKIFTYILKVPVTPLIWKTFGEEKAAMTYNGKTQYIELNNYDENEMEVSPAPVKIPVGEPNAGKWAIAVKDCVDKSVKVDLKDTNFAGWSDVKPYQENCNAQRFLDYKVNAKSLTVTASGSWSTQVNSVSKSYDVYIDVFDSDIESIEFEGYYKKVGGTEKKISAPTVTKEGDDRAKVTVTLPNSLESGIYEYILKLKSGTVESKNYTLNFSKNFTVESKNVEIGIDDIVWRYSNIKLGADIAISNTDLVDGIFNVDYNGELFTFDVDTDLLSKDAEYKVEGEKSATLVKTNGTAVEYYTATLKITPKDGVEIEIKEFNLKWRINKAKFDLSNVRWDYSLDKPKQFNDKEQEVVMTGIPDGLTFNYINNKKRFVGKYNAEVMTISVRSDLKNNYLTPEVDKKDTYKGDILWNINWQIKKAELELDWTPKQEKDVNDKVYLSWESTTFSDKIEYKYYTVEAYDDGKLTGNPIDKSSIIVPDEEAEIQYYIIALVKETFEANYEIIGTWAMPFLVGSMATVINISMPDEFTYDTFAHGNEWYSSSVSGMEYIKAQYFKVEDGNEILLDGVPTDAGSYIVRLSVDEEYLTSYQLSKSKLTYVIIKAQIEITVDRNQYDYDGSQHAGEFSIATSNYDISKIKKTYYKGMTKDFPLAAEKLPCDAGDYLVELSLSDLDRNNYEIKVNSEFAIKINKANIIVKWINDENGIPFLSGLSDTLKAIVGYVYYDEKGNQLEGDITLELGRSYTVKAILTGNYVDNYQFVAEDGETIFENPAMTDGQDFIFKDKNNSQGGNVNGGLDGNVTLDGILGKLKEMPLWQLIASVISLILAIIFLSKTASYDNKRRKLNKKADKLNTLYAGTYLGIATTVWTAIAWVLMCFAVISLIMMIVAKHRYVKAADNYEDVFEEYQQKKEEKKEENLRIMFMGMGNNGMAQGMPQGGYVVQQGLGIDDMRGLISEAVTALLPGMQQALPQQASANDELVQKLLEKTTKNEDTMQKLIKKMAEQPAERIVEREVAASVSDELLEKLVNKLHPVADDETLLKVVNHTEQNNETIKQLLKNQEMLMQKILELSAQNNAGNTQVVEKIVEKPVEKIVEVPVEKIIEKEVVKEVKVEVPVEQIVEKVVEKAVPVAAAPKAKKEVAPRLTLDEAYEKLSKQQKKFFDGLREYAMKKEKCKEKKSTYNILLGQSSVNPLVKLTIKKDVTVALFKMEDEYLKDIRRNASNDGAKIKVKETEIAIGDAQAYSAAKEMIDLREDQIERYQDFLKEQRSMKNR